MKKQSDYKSNRGKRSRRKEESDQKRVRMAVSKQKPTYVPADDVLCIRVFPIVRCDRQRLRISVPFSLEGEATRHFVLSSSKLTPPQKPPPLHAITQSFHSCSSCQASGCLMIRNVRDSIHLSSSSRKLAADTRAGADACVFPSDFINPEDRQSLTHPVHSVDFSSVPLKRP